MVTRNYSWCLAFVLFSAAFLSAGEELLKVMRSYEGRWVGQFTLHSAATGYTETFPVEQQYWMSGEKLHGVAVSGRNSGLQSARSETCIVRDKLVSEITKGDTVERYLGVIHEGGVLWLPEQIERANDHQLKETILIIAGARHIKTEGFDTYNFNGEKAVIVYRGDLELQDESPEP